MRCFLTRIVPAGLALAAMASVPAHADWRWRGGPFFAEGWSDSYPPTRDAPPVYVAPGGPLIVYPPAYDDPYGDAELAPDAGYDDPYDAGPPSANVPYPRPRRPRVEVVPPPDAAPRPPRIIEGPAPVPRRNAARLIEVPAKLPAGKAVSARPAVVKPATAMAEPVGSLPGVTTVPGARPLPGGKPNPVAKPDSAAARPALPPPTAKQQDDAKLSPIKPMRQARNTVALPVPRPNLESMDFAPSKPATAPEPVLPTPPDERP